MSLNVSNYTLGSNPRRLTERVSNSFCYSRIHKLVLLTLKNAVILRKNRHFTFRLYLMQYNTDGISQEHVPEEQMSPVAVLKLAGFH